MTTQQKEEEDSEQQMETFNRLRRIPIKEMYNLAEVWMRTGSDHRHFEELLEEHGWNRIDYHTAIQWK